MRSIISTIVTMALIAAALVVLPCLMEDTSSTCSAYVARQYRIGLSLSDTAPNDGPGGRVKLAAGAAMEAQVKASHPGDPPVLVCALMYWQTVLARRPGSASPAATQ